jgi:hypothetical protein
MKVHCDQCESLVINNIPTHELGCPNARKTWQINEETERIEPIEDTEDDEN